MSVGYGQLVPSDTSSDVNQQIFLFKQLSALMRTCTLVKVLAVTNSGGVVPVGFVDIQILVHAIDGANNATDHGTIYNVPYLRVQGGTNAIILDPVVGDIGIAVFADRDISRVKNTKAAAAPGSGRRYDAADALYIGGVLNTKPTCYVDFTGTGIVSSPDSGTTTISIKAGNITMSPDGGTTTVTAAPGKVTITATTVAVVGNLTVTGNVTAGSGGSGSVDLLNHKHSSSGGTGTGGPPVPGS